jgi:hypothetical protein
MTFFLSFLMNCDLPRLADLAAHMFPIKVASSSKVLFEDFVPFNFFSALMISTAF